MTNETNKSLIPAEQVPFGLPTNARGFVQYAATDGGPFLGDLLRLNGKTGRWHHGTENVELANGTTLTAFIGQATAGYIRWRDGKPETQAWLNLIEGNVDLKSLRATLGELDTAAWTECAPDGRPLDPFRESVRMPMIRLQDGQLFTFSASSMGGCRAVKHLVKVCLIQARAAPETTVNRVPTVELGASSYTHSSRSIGKIFAPDFKIVEWIPVGHVMHALGAKGHAATFGDPSQEALNADLGTEPTDAEVRSKVQHTPEKPRRSKTGFA